MYQVIETENFSNWLAALKDSKTKTKITAQVRKMTLGNLGDVAPVGEGVSETKLHFGPGYRLYHIKQGNIVIILLVGGTKRTQSKDIKKAKALAKQIKEDK